MLKKIGLVLLPLALALLLSGCSLNLGRSPAALQIETNVPANVFIDAKSVGKTPYSSSELTAKEVTVKLIPDATEIPLASWEGRVKLEAGTWTSIRREFAASEEQSSGQVLSLEKIRDAENGSVALISAPDGAVLEVNGEDRGLSPQTLEGVTPGNYLFRFSYADSQDRTFKARIPAGYRLIANVDLARTKKDEGPTPTPTGTATAGELERPYVEVKETGLGFLRVRSGPSTGSEEVARVTPGEKYALLDEENGWYQIGYAEGKKGWIAGQYATKFE